MSLPIPILFLADFDGPAIPLLAIAFTFLWLIAKAIMAPFVQKASRAQSAVDRLTQEEQTILLRMQQTLSDMENRIEALETILIEDRRSGEHYESKR